MQITTIKPVVKNTAPSLTKNIIQFRSNFVNLPKSSEDNRGMAMSVMSELMQFGYILSAEAIDNISVASRENIISFHNDVISYLKFLTGAGKNYTPFWGGFPQQVMDSSEFELWMHQIIYYFSNATYEPTEWTKQKPTAFEQPKYAKISLGSEEQFEKIFTSRVSVNQSLTPEDLDIVKFFVESGSALRFPEQIPFKENMSTLVSIGVKLDIKLTVTDILRIAVGMSKGDVSLPKVPHKLVKMNRWSSHRSENPAREAFKFKKFKRSERKIILSLLEKTNCDVKEAVLKSQRWIRLAEILHPGEYKNQFPKSFSLFNKIRNEKVQSWYGQVNTAFDNSFENGLEVLSERPGEYMRKLDWLVRAEMPSKKKVKNTQFSILEKYASDKTNDKTSLEIRQDLALDTLKKVVLKVSNKVLYEAYSHFENRYVGTSNRSIMVKVSRKRTPLPELPALSSDIIQTIQKIIVGALIEKFSKLEKLGKVYVDEELKKIPMPTNMRSINPTLKPTIRGQRTPIGNQNSKVIRAFVHWFDEQGTIDIDLHGFLIGENRRENIGWNSNHKTGYGCFSGDIIARQGACAEYVDVNIDKALKDGLRYLVVTVNNFRGGSLSDITDCVSGIQEREFPEANMNFVPATLSNCMRLTSAASTSLMCVVDLETREYIHLDLDLDNNSIPIASHQSAEILNSIKPYLELPKFSVYDLLLLHVQGRNGELVDNTEKADTYFAFDDFASSYVNTLNLMGI